MLKGDYSKLDTKAVFILYRVSTEFAQEEWYQIFESMYYAGIADIIFVPVELADLRDMLNEKIRHIKSLIRKRKDIQCGWLYSEKEFLKMFKGRGGKTLYMVKDKMYFDGTGVFLLERE